MKTKMIDYGVKEIQCTNCSHKDVCSLKAEFSEAQKTIDEACLIGLTTILIRDIEYIETVKLHCKHYSNNITFRDNSR